MQAEHEHESDNQHAHGHRHLLGGRAFEVGFAVSMLFGRGGMARTIADLADLTDSDVVVDVGCGPGTAVRRARRAGAGRAVGVDPSPQMVRLGRWVNALRRVDGIDLVEGSAEHLPLEGHSATVVWAIQSVHHWADRRRGLEEALRVLEPGGRLIFLEGYAEPGTRGRAKHGSTEAQAGELQSLVASAGFVDVERRLVRVGRKNFTAITASAPLP